MTRRERLKRMNELKMQILTDPFYMTYDSDIEWGWGRAGKIMFIRQCPTGDTEFKESFLELLEPMGLTQKDFYFTNLIKRQVIISEIDPKDIAESTSYLRIETEIVKPELIVTLGSHAKEWFGKLNINFYSIVHPSATRYGSITEEIWRHRLKQIITTNKLMKGYNYEV